MGSRRMLRTVGVGLVAMMAAGLGSCAYSTKPLYPKSVKTIAVPVWQNKTFRRDWEMRLTEAIDKNIEMRTPFKVVSQDRADTVLTGEIVRIDELPLTRTFGINLPRETELTVVVNFTWKDTRTGKVLMTRKEFNRSATEIPQIGERVWDAEQWAIERAAAGIVDQLQTDW